MAILVQFSRTILGEVLADGSREARELVAAYAGYVYGSPIAARDVLWYEGEWTIDSMPVDEWLEAMTS